MSDDFIDLDPEEDDRRAIEFCYIASGIQLIREITYPYILEDNRNFEGSLYHYLKRCPSRLDAARIPKNIPKSHKWWQHATGKKPSNWELDTAKNQPCAESSEKGNVNIACCIA